MQINPASLDARCTVEIGSQVATLHLSYMVF